MVKDYHDLNPITQEPKIAVWNRYNEILFDCMKIQREDENNPGDIAANDHDHVLDDHRYGLMAFRSEFIPNKAQPAQPASPGFRGAVFAHMSRSTDGWMG